jgi:hypothetical protein
LLLFSSVSGTGLDVGSCCRRYLERNYWRKVYRDVFLYLLNISIKRYRQDYFQFPKKMLETLLILIILIWLHRLWNWIDSIKKSQLPTTYITHS